jgi:hypothetical protein
MTARRMQDSDGNVWEESGDDGAWVELKSHSWLPSLDVLERLWGPLTEVAQQ